MMAKAALDASIARQKSRFSADISLFLGNYIRYSHSYYRMRIGNYTEAGF